MICKRCQRSLRSNEGIKCGICESCLNMQCIGDTGKELRDHRAFGDKGYEWKCSLCHNYIKTVPSSASESCKEKDEKHNNLMHAVSAISDKFELVNKIQLPKLSSDLVQIKSVADRIVQQNESIFKKIVEVEEKRREDQEAYKKSKSKRRYRKRNIKFVSKLERQSKNNEVPVPITEKSIKYRTRRRSYLLNRIFKILNRKVPKSK